MTKNKFVRFVASVLASLIILIAIFGSFYTVDQGERAVVLRNGKIISTAEPGLHYKFPIIDDIATISVQTRKANYDKVWVYSRDQQTATMHISVNYKPVDVAKIYSEYGGEEAMVDRIITPKVNQQLKNVFGQFNAVAAIQERARLNAESQNALMNSIRAEIVIIESVQIENIDFSDAYEKSIEDRMLAEVEVQKIEQNLEREKVQADIVTTKARAEAEATKLRGEAEAYAILARGKALRDSPELVALTQAEKWDGKLPTQMIPSNALPIIGLSK